MRTRKRDVGSIYDNRQVLADSKQMTLIVLFPRCFIL